MKTAIIYYSRHHGNTKKLVDAVAAKHNVDIFDVVEKPDADLSGYDTIGIASGTYAWKFAKQILTYINNHLPEGKKVFFISTSASGKAGYEKSAAEACKKKNCEILGSYTCMGFNTFGPTKLFGGTGKGHPDEKEIQGAVDFFESLNIT